MRQNNRGILSDMQQVAAVQHCVYLGYTVTLFGTTRFLDFVHCPLS
jgi:hypothetical protein